MRAPPADLSFAGNDALEDSRQGQCQADLPAGSVMGDLGKDFKYDGEVQQWVPTSLLSEAEDMRVHVQVRPLADDPRDVQVRPLAVDPFVVRPLAVDPLVVQVRPLAADLLAVQVRPLAVDPSDVQVVQARPLAVGVGLRELLWTAWLPSFRR